jgi:DNA-binding NarL/FixJ family response regulator
MASEQRPIRVSILDDHPLYAAGITDFLRSHSCYAVVGIARSASEALSVALSADVAVINWAMIPEPEAFVQGLLARKSNLAIIVVSADDGIEVVARALQAGALAFLPKSVTQRDMLSAIDAVVKGSSYVPPAFGAALISHLSYAQPSTPDIPI